jgi:hypothetical protein
MVREGLGALRGTSDCYATYFTLRYLSAKLYYHVYLVDGATDNVQLFTSPCDLPYPGRLLAFAASSSSLRA